MSPVILHWPGGPIIAEVVEEIDGEALLSIRFGDALVFVMPAGCDEALIDAIMEAAAERSAPVRPPL